MYRSLQEFVERLEREGELIRIKARVSSRFEIAELTDRQAKSEGGGKALLFENTDAEFPVVTNMMGSSRRMAMALGVERLEQIGERIDALLKEALSPKGSLWEKMRMLPLLADMSKWFPQTVSGRGACQEVVYQGDEVDLERLPMLHSWEADGGAFVTLPMVNTIDPETGMRNVGMYRMQRFDKHTTGMHWPINVWDAVCPWLWLWAVIQPIPMPPRHLCPTIWTNICWPVFCVASPCDWSRR